MMRLGWQPKWPLGVDTERTYAGEDTLEATSTQIDAHDANNDSTPALRG